MNKIKAAKLNENAILPTRKHPNDAGIDFYAAEPIVIAAHDFGVVKTGITLEIPKGFVGLLMPKSRNNHLLGAGVVDAGYQGEIQIKIANIKDESLEIGYGQAVGQMLIIPIETPEIEEIDIAVIHSEVSERGATGGILGNSK